MTPQPIKKEGTGQLNLNTILLGICVTLSGWALKSIEDLKEEMVGVRSQTEQNSNTIQSQNRVQLEQEKTIEQLSIRINTVETKESDHSNKN